MYINNSLESFKRPDYQLCFTIKKCKSFFDSDAGIIVTKLFIKKDGNVNKKAEKFTNGEILTDYHNYLKIEREIFLTPLISSSSPNLPSDLSSVKTTNLNNLYSLNLLLTVRFKPRFRLFFIIRTIIEY